MKSLNRKRNRDFHRHSAKARRGLPDSLPPFLREIAARSQIHQRLIGVVTEKRFHIVSPRGFGVQLIGVLQLVVIEFQQQIEGETLQFFTSCPGDLSVFF